MFWADPYLTELTARVTSICGNALTVDRTIAFASSGGQESDHGTIAGHNIISTEKIGKQILYSLDAAPVLQAGDEVLIRIDWQRRFRLIRLHFAAELVLELIMQHYDNPSKIGAHIAEDKARVDFVWQGNISETFPLLERETHRLIEANLPIISAFKDEENEIRFWEIEGFAKVPCGGTHPRTTGEIGALSFRRNNIGRGKERIEITLVP